uniref:Uncharacterized protein n=1 Tax=Romanomermis culicivorax TaxID=13658 RepID=A0A915IJF2_ROMCU
MQVVGADEPKKFNEKVSAVCPKQIAQKVFRVVGRRSSFLSEKSTCVILEQKATQLIMVIKKLFESHGAIIDGNRDLKSHSNITQSS